MSESRVYTVNLRLPEILAQRVKSAVEKRRCESARFSMNDWLIEAIRAGLDGARPPAAVVKASELPPPVPRVEDRIDEPKPFKAAPPPPQTFNWSRQFAYWVARDQGGAEEMREFLTDAGVPPDVMRRPTDKILTWCKYNLPDGPRKESA